MENRASEQLYRRACGLIPGGVNSPVRAFRKVGGTPVYFASAQGATVTDVDGNRYFDYCQSWGPLILGHAHPQVVAAVQQAAVHGLSYGACHPAELRLAELILDGFPQCERVRLVSSGTEAVMTALRLARGFTGRELTVKFDGGYHGHFDGMLVKAGSGLATLALADSGGVAEAMAATTLVAQLDDEESVGRLFAAHGDRIAAVIIEPLPGNNGLLPQRRDFLAFLREITAQHGALLIFDEVISGFRLCYGGYGAQVGVECDLVTLGKIVGGGMPIGAVAGRAEILELLAPLGPVYQAGTLSGNPVSVAAGIATLELLQQEQPYGRLEALGELFDRTLAAAAPAWGRTSRVGSIVWLHADEGPLPRTPGAVSAAAVGRFNSIYRQLLEQGHYLPPSALEVLFISSAHRPEQVEATALAIGKALTELAGER